MMTIGEVVTIVYLGRFAIFKEKFPLNMLPIY